MLIGSAPCAASQERSRGVSNAAEMPSDSTLTIGLGVPAGAQVPYPPSFSGLVWAADHRKEES